jgi:hypothetical protein
MRVKQDSAEQSPIAKILQAQDSVSLSHLVEMSGARTVWMLLVVRSLWPYAPCGEPSGLVRHEGVLKVKVEYRGEIFPCDEFRASVKELS